jgi:hypothetical protein
MKNLLRVLLLGLCTALPAPSWSGSMTLLGVGSPGVAAPTYQGPGDVAGSAATVWGSVARAYNGAYANGTNSLADLKDKNTGTVAICTLRVLTTGFVDLAGNYCTGPNTPALACAAAAGGSCVISKIYNQVSPGTHDAVQATLASMPGITFSNAGINNLPAMDCSVSTAAFVATDVLTISQPITYSAVAKDSGGTDNPTLGANSASQARLGFSGNIAVTSLMRIDAGTAVTQAAAVNVWHAMQGVLNGASSAINVDGTDNGSLNAGTNAYSAVALRVCRDGNGNSGGNQLVPEFGLWPAALDATHRGLVNTNQHSATNGYNF